MGIGNNTVDQREPITEEQLDQIEKVFESMSTYKDGKILASEFGDFFTKIDFPYTDEQLTGIVRPMLEATGDGDWIPWGLVRKLAQVQHDPKLSMVEYAAMFDQDNSGFISAEEFKKGMEAIRVFNPNNFEKVSVEFKQFVEEADSNKDGKVSVAEFMEWLSVKL